MSAPTAGISAVRVEGLVKEYAARRSLVQRNVAVTRALDDVSFALSPHASLGIVGESGSGKTTLARALVRLVRPDAGRIEVEGRDVLALRGAELRRSRRRVQLVYQDPYSSLNPAFSVGAAIAEPAVVHGLVDRADGRDRSIELMEQVGLRADLVDRRPRELSGGQRQRVAIARALALEPSVLIADEAVSALDVSVQAQVLRLFDRLRQELGLTLLFVSHQLATVAQICDQVAIMYRGRIVELGPTAEVFRRPRHGYTAALIRAHPGQGRRRRGPLHVPAASVELPGGCPFHHRCEYAVDRCRRDVPAEHQVTPHHVASCHVLVPDPDARRTRPSH